MSEFINTADVIGDGAMTDQIIMRTVTEYKENRISKVGQYALYGCAALTVVDIPNVTKIDQYAFFGCTALPEMNAPNVETIGNYAFSGCKILTKLSAPKVTNIGGNAFNNCPVTEFDFSNVNTIGSYAFRYGKFTSVVLPKIEILGYEAFYDCASLSLVDLPIAVQLNNQCFRATNLTALILRNAVKVVQLPATGSFINTPIASGTGYIYVPRALVDSYKVATNWSTYAAQFRALEDYTIDGTITGELDSSKI